MEDNILGWLTSLGLGCSHYITSDQLGLVQLECSFSILDFSYTLHHSMERIIENKNLSTTHCSLEEGYARCIVGGQLDLVLLVLYMANLFLGFTNYQIEELT